MTEWGVFLVISALAAFLAAVIAPITKLTQSITKLTVVVERLTNDMQELKQQSEERDNKLWSHNDDQDAKLADHETRLQLLEKAE